ncbi:multiple sugar transport system substrate-binding protein [Salana multivorans]|uniref:Multiple sugar transport system substrate-binding protein n=1 Tax=Salana multivorans TaxID=120377 RepID=A0A3N2D2H9_9MICO|nr:sugar ABC transporter substrate-binding protein [Salana multivorans]ROR93970.1 multiple sugar transport system substrate-binding protein [Salana multivorans]
MQRKLAMVAALGAATALALAGCSSSNPGTGGTTGSGSTDGSSGSTDGGGSGGDITLDFSQWWEVELAPGVMRGLMDRFEEENPGVTVNLISNPYSATVDLQTSAAATGTLACLVAINGASVYDLKTQGAITNLSTLMDEAGFDPSTLVSNDQIDGATYMVRALNFAYPMYYNLDLLEAAGITKLPETRSEFEDAATKVTNPDTNVYAWSLPINVQSPAGFDSQSWLWASGGRFLKDRKPNFETPEIANWLGFLKSQYDAGVITPGAFTQQEQQKVEEFTAGRNAMMNGSLAHISGIRESNPDLSFDIGYVPVEDGFTGERGLAGASWGMGIAENCEHKAEAWKLVEFVMSTDVNSELATEATGFPGSVDAVPGYVDGDPLYEKAFEVYQNSEFVTELEGLPNALDLNRNLNENLVRLLQGDATIEETQSSLQEYWTGVLG